MEYLVGVSLALAVSLGASFVGLDRDRAFYPTVTIVIAALYGLFAVLGASNAALLLESLAGAAFLFVAILGFKRNLWLVVIALAVHGIFDWIHGDLISNPGVPSWYPGFCLTYDVVAAGYLAWLLGSSRRTAASRITLPARSS
jgi:hypothetical protein